MILVPKTGNSLKKESARAVKHYMRNEIRESILHSFERFVTSCIPRLDVPFPGDP